MRKKNTYRKRRKHRRKKTRRKRGGKFLCGPDKDFVPEVHFNELESILENLKEKTAGGPLKDIVSELPPITKDKGKCYGCKELINELVLNTMPPTRILPIENKNIKWLQQFTGVHKGRMCTIMGGRRKKKTRKKRGRGKCASKPKYDDEKAKEQIAKSIEHMEIQQQKLKEIIKASTCEDGSLDLQKMLLKITEHQEQKGGHKRKRKSRRRK